MDQPSENGRRFKHLVVLALVVITTLLAVVIATLSPSSQAATDAIGPLTSLHDLESARESLQAGTNDDPVALVAFSRSAHELTPGDGRLLVEYGMRLGRQDEDSARFIGRIVSESPVHVDTEIIDSILLLQSDASPDAQKCRRCLVLCFVLQSIGSPYALVMHFDWEDIWSEDVCDTLSSVEFQGLRVIRSKLGED